MKLDEIQEIFFQECEEALAAVEAGLLAFQSDQYDDETINTIFRAVHSIKGGSGAFGFHALQSFTHKYETVLDLARAGELAITAALTGILLRAFDMMSDHIGAIRGNGDTPDDAEIITLLVAAANDTAKKEQSPTPTEVASEAPLDFNLDDLMQILGDAEIASIPESPSASDSWTLEVRPSKGALTHGGEPMLLIRELLEHGARFIDTDISAVPTLDAIDPDEAYLGWAFAIPMQVSEATVRDIFDFVLDSCDLKIIKPASDDSEQMPSASVPTPTPTPAIIPAAAKPVAASPPQTITATNQTIRVDLEKLDRLVNLVGELVITQAMLAQRLSTHGKRPLPELTDLDQLTRELQDSAMSIRAQPIKSIFNRVPRIVRELEAETGKQVRLEVEGEMTELDKTVVERIGDPLTHLIRNAIDHGLETPEVRLAAGKPAQGVLKLSAEHRSGKILLSVSDDGAGIDRRRVLAKAIERGLITAGDVLTDEEIDHLIFAPGFSTVDTVSNISGRGVGMDVVRKNVEALGGRISIQSRPGQGAVFTLALPLTLAILDGMIVAVGDQTYVIPLTHIVENLRPQASEVTTMGNGRLMLNVRGNFLPIEPVGQRLGIANAETDPTRAVLIVVETEGNGHSVLMVDGILDQRQVVIKSLETNYRPIDGLAGATILGDGRVALILDVETLAIARTGRKLAA